MSKQNMVEMDSGRKLLTHATQEAERYCQEGSWDKVYPPKGHLNDLLLQSVRPHHLKVHELMNGVTDKSGLS